MYKLFPNTNNSLINKSKHQYIKTKLPITCNIYIPNSKFQVRNELVALESDSRENNQQYEEDSGDKRRNHSSTRPLTKIVKLLANCYPVCVCVSFVSQGYYCSSRGSSRYGQSQRNLHIYIYIYITLLIIY